MITVIMKRDMDLIRAILLKLEVEPSGYAQNNMDIPGYTKEQIDYHVLLLGEAELAIVEKIATPISGYKQPIISRLTWTGHEFFDSACENARWNQAKDAINKIGGASMTI